MKYVSELKQYIGRNKYKALLILLIFVFLYVTVQLAPSVDIDDYTNISQDELFFSISSSCCFLSILFLFVYMIIRRQEKIIGTNKGLRFYTLILLAVSYVTALYVLLDVFISDIYLDFAVVLFVNILITSLNIDIPELTVLPSDEFYFTIRNGMFDVCLIIYIIVPVILLSIVLTRYGRKRFIEKISSNMSDTGLFTFLLFFIIPIINLILILDYLENEFIPFLVIIGLSMIWWIYQLYKLIKYTIKNGFTELRSSISIFIYFVLPIVAVFWILPALALIGIEIWINFIENGIMDLETIVTFILDNMLNYIFDIVSIIILDFVIITVIATFTVGFAEGNSITSIIGVFKGKNIDSGPSEPRTTTITKAVSLITVWTSLLLSYIASLWNQFIEAINLDLQEIDFPGLLTWLEENVFSVISTFIDDFMPFLSFILIIMLPLYIILASLFKFFSISSITQRIEAFEYFLIIISTVFLLILLQILGEINMLGYENVPLDSLEIEGLLYNALGVFQLSEAVFYFLGILFIPYVFIKRIRNKKLPDIEMDQINELNAEIQI